jgi:uncharacterized protein YegL
MNDILKKRITGKSPMHMVLVADDSGSMKGAPAADATRAIHAWVNELYVKTRGKKPYFRFSLVSFGSAPAVVAEAMDVRDVDVTSFVLAGDAGSTNLTDALMTVRQILARDGATAEHCPPFVFLFTDGRPTDPTGKMNDAAAQTAQDAASALKMLPLACGSPFIVTLGFGAVVDAFLQQLASAPNLYHRISSAQELIQLLPEIGTPTVEGVGEEGTVGNFLRQVGGISDL